MTCCKKFEPRSYLVLGQLFTVTPYEIKEPIMYVVASFYVTTNPRKSINLQSVFDKA